jgi:hypothetical protein
MSRIPNTDRKADYAARVKNKSGGGGLNAKKRQQEKCGHLTKKTTRKTWASYKLLPLE